VSARLEEALLFKRIPYGESSLVIQACTPSGRVHFLAKGAYRATSNYYCVLDLFDTLELEWSAQPRRELQLLRRGRVLVRRRRLSRELASYRVALAMLELADIGSQHEQPDSGLYGRLVAGLDALESGAEAQRTLVEFELGFLQTLGLAPALSACAACTREAAALDSDPGRVAFSAGAGGRLCQPCAVEARRSGRRVGTMPLSVIESAARLLGGAPDCGPESGPAADQLERVRDLVERFMAFHLTPVPRFSKAFLSAPNRNAPDRTAPDHTGPDHTGQGRAPEFELEPSSE